ncbi:mechanosensitive ion channel family protein [Cellulosilyticum sp. I15G10I2]|uniref:mechanosensitive ion channel family protein n=1 Tax=Cellulosilyticum sp. I15G10I2 TaxID=1892843 RepID=UPI00085CCA26|nr:mechanosensitive ion channel domain-containing protein [Cellulosilyticum sp. I15G10I2]
MNVKEKLMEITMQYSPIYLGALLVLFIGFKVIKGIIHMLDNTLTKSKVDMSLHSFIKSVASFILKIIVLITAATIVGIPMTTFIAVLSAAGLAVGLALKDSLSNFAGGVLILTFRPFNVGDFIEAQGYMGTVTTIHLLYTYLTTVDNKRVVIPNGDLANGKMINYSVEDTRRVDLIFGVGYQEDIVKVKGILNKISIEHPLILKDPEPIIRVAEHAESSINFAVKVWCKKEDYWSIYYDLQEQVKVTFDKEGISIPFPQRDVHIYQTLKNSD